MGGCRTYQTPCPVPLKVSCEYGLGVLLGRIPGYRLLCTQGSPKP